MSRLADLGTRRIEHRDGGESKGRLLLLRWEDHRKKTSFSSPLMSGWHLNIQMNFEKPVIVGLAPHFPGYNIGETLPVATSWAERG